MKIDVTNPALEKYLLELQTLLLNEGAFLHPQLTILERNGNFGVRSDLLRTLHDCLLKVPITCLPSLAAFDLRIAGDDICIDNVADGTSSTHKRCMELMLAIYSTSGKLAEVRKKSPWFALANFPELLQKLLCLREGVKKFEKNQRLLEKKQFDKLLLSNFLGTRHFNLPGEKGQVLMPFIDYINHHHLATGFMSGDIAGSQALSVNNSKPVSDTEEVFVCYFSMMDPVDSWLNYNFVDEATPIAKSIPLVLNIGSGRQIRIKAFSAGNKQAPKQLKDLTVFMPAIIEKTENYLTVSRLIIPHEKAPLALRRVLGFLIRTLCPELGNTALQSHVEKAEAEVIGINIKYYRDLAAAVELSQNEIPAESPHSQIQRIAELQLAKLSAYQKRIEEKFLVRGSS